MKKEIARYGPYEVTQREKAGKFIRKFDKTPEGIHCPHFWLMTLGQACPFGCAYCFLQGTFRKMIDFNRPTVYTNQDDMKKEVRKFLTAEEPRVLNTGELNDSLAYDPYTKVMNWLIPEFGGQEKHLLLLLTKSSHVTHILDLNHNGRVRISFSVNSIEASAHFEGSAAPISERINAARLAQDAGYRIGIRIDPMLPIEDWEEKYSEVLDMMCRRKLAPEVITLGTLRYFPAVKAFAKVWGRNPVVWNFEKSRDGVDKRYRLSTGARKAMYTFMLTEIKSRWPYVPVGICKETVEMRNELGFTNQDNKCNCTF